MTQKVSVLIVDDESELRKSVASVLGSAMPAFEFTVTEACNGREAVDMVKARDFDLVLMDVRMPEMDGLEALAQIKTEDPRVFVVIMTAHSNLQDAIHAIKAGAYDYVEKPVQPTKLAQIVQKALETQEMVSSLAISAPVLDDDVDSIFFNLTQQRVLRNIGLGDSLIDAPAIGTQGLHDELLLGLFLEAVEVQRSVIGTRQFDGHISASADRIQQGFGQRGRLDQA